MLTTLIEYINDHEDWLMERILDYAQKRDYTKYASTLKEAWRLSISGLSKSLVELIKAKGNDIELGPEEDYRCDPATGAFPFSWSKVSACVNEHCSS